MTFPDESFDCVLDKATVDAMMAGKDTAACQAVVQAYCAETARVLRPGGVFLLITHNDPEEEGMSLVTEAVLPGLEMDRVRWSVDIHSMEEGNGEMPHIYAIRKTLLPNTRAAARGEGNTGVSIDHHIH